MKNKPFIETLFFGKDGKIIIKAKEKKKEESYLISYFKKSLFFSGLFKPEGLNIVPKDEPFFDGDLTTGYKYSAHNYGIRDFNIRQYEELEIGSFFRKQPMEETIIEFNGTFVAYEEKMYSSYWNNESKKLFNCDVMPFIMLDNGAFNTKIEFHEEGTIIVITNVDVVRNVIGYNFDGKSIRDGLFQNFLHEDFRSSIQICEYYRMIANGTRLLHFSDNSDFFEVYDLPHNWSSRNGISTLNNPKVFDNIDFDVNDKDLDEIKGIIALYKNNHGKVLTKNNN